MKKMILLTLLLTLTLVAFAAQYTVNGNQNEVKVISTGAQSSVLEMTLGHFDREQIRINGEVYWTLSLKKEGVTQELGLPQLPYISRSLAIPGTAKMQVQVLGSDYTDISMPVAPSKGILTRDIDPETVPWTFGSFYQGEGSYPAELSRLSEPFIIRDYRGITVYFQPFVYYPATRTLRVYTKLALSVNNVGTDDINIMPAGKSSASAWFEGIYKSMFINYNQAKYPVLDEQGRMLIITNSMFNATLQPYIDWKRQKGFTVDVVDITVAGPTATQLKTYIQTQYDQGNDLAFVQIIGDAAQVPTLTASGGGSDPSFALTVGTDSYPDLFVGRFSAQTTTDLETQVTRTIYYERDMQANNAWLATGTGIASAQGGGSQGDLGESDAVHMNNIRTDLLNYGYTVVDQIYDTNGGTAAMISTAVNAGRGFMNYCGHGADTYWVTTGFSNTHVNQLTNNNKLPFIASVACVNGNFPNQTCFAEAWLRARDSVTGSPRGAMAFYGSTINQSWNSPMRGQDEITDLLTTNQKNTIGGLFFNGSSKMIEVYSTDGINMFKTWHIFGDASLQVRTIDPQPLTATFNPILNIGSTSFTVQTSPGAWVTLYANSMVYGTGYADASGNAVINITAALTEPIDLTLTITGFNKITYLGTVQVQNATGPYLQVDSQIVTDGDNNIAEYGETIGFNLSLANVGVAEASIIAATISSADSYITITDNHAVYDNIAAGQTLASTDGFAIQIATNVPDQHVAVLHVVITQNGVTSWVYDINFVMNAPAFMAGGLVIDDSEGNNNGRLDTGEIDLITFPVTNNGHAAAENLLFSLLVNNQVNYLLTPIQANFPLLAAGATAQVLFEVTFSSQVPVGTLAQFTLMGFAGDYSVLQNFSSYIGLNIESFDGGTFTSYPWAFTGANWTLDSTVYHSGTSSAKSGLIVDSGSTTMTVAMTVQTAGTISFWKNVSSEQSYDYLKFYINDVLQNQWSGELAWSQETFNVNPGAITFKWEYMKDYMVSSGSDCAWIDDILFPSAGGTTGTPAISLSVTAMDFGSHLAADFTALPLSVTNSGDATMIGTITGNSLFRIKPQQDETYTESVNYVIPAGLTLNFDVMVFPQAEGTLSGNLTITSDDPLHTASFLPVSAVVLPTGNGDNQTVAVTALKGIYPNPFNPATTVSFSLKQGGRVTVEIYNLLGQRVKTLVNTGLKSGNYSYRWDSRDDNGRQVGSGIYFCRMQSGSYQTTAKLVLMK
jgi:hypothetical protein